MYTPPFFPLRIPSRRSHTPRPRAARCSGRCGKVSPREPVSSVGGVRASREGAAQRGGPSRGRQRQAAEMASQVRCFCGRRARCRGGEALARVLWGASVDWRPLVACHGRARGMGAARRLAARALEMPLGRPQRAAGALRASLDRTKGWGWWEWGWSARPRAQIAVRRGARGAPARLSLFPSSRKSRRKGRAPWLPRSAADPPLPRSVSPCVTIPGPHRWCLPGRDV